MQYLSLFLTFLCLYVVHGNADTKDVVIKKSERKIDLTSQLVKISNRLTIENTGSSPIKYIIYALPSDEQQNLAFISSSGPGNAELPVTYEKEKKEGHNYRINLREPLSTGKSISIEVELVLTHTLEPYPKSITQGEKHLVQYTGNHYFYTPYSVTSQTTVVLVSSNVISYSKLKPVSLMDAAITYGLYKEIPPFSVDEMKVHYENSSPFLTITRLERMIEVSHWGNVAVEETIDILHTGAKLKGSFSRYDYQREHSQQSGIKYFRTVLPAAAKDVYYRDDIGNISTSNMRLQEDAVELDLRPRFPLFGGWKTKYTIGYNVPSYEYLYSSANDYVLKIRFIDHIYDDMVVEEALVKIILPEGASDIELQSPFKITRHPDEMHYTYLDVLGRKVIVMSKKNLVENHIQYFELGYKSASYWMLFEPFLVFTAFFIFFITIIFCVRLDLTISKDETAELKMRISSLCELVHSHHDKRAGYYEKFEEEIQKFKSSHDISGTQNATKKIVASVKEENNALSELSVKLRPDSPQYSERVNELQKQDKIILECLQQQLAVVEKMIGGKLNKQVFTENNKNIQNKKEAAIEKVKSVLATI